MLAAQGADTQAGTALADLCAAYYAPVHDYIARTAHDLGDPATRLGISEGAVKVAIHRLRKRFRDLVKAEIAQTVADEKEAREELRYLIEVVR